ncbi:ABC transporter substrate-binding protein [Paenibacillus tarimensis]|uniref:ABC transporter substrate-binding protein n=1 Tax=Paenibacillus tarimensis TaxID=416012 RepID=UPI001F275BE8|nr:ABC transporter substrate-binding protein [Paenibacillus tarimensis]
MIKLFSLLLIFVFTGCSSTTESQPLVTQPYLSLIDDTGREVIVTSKPERVVILNPEALRLFYQLGGTVSGFASAPGIPVPEAAKASVNVGQINQVSLEKLISLRPDLVIGHPFFHENLKDSHETSNVPLALLSISSYEAVQNYGKLFGQLLGKGTEADMALKETEARIQSILSKLPARSTTFAAVTIMPMGISLQKSGTLTLDIADKLRLINVAESMESGEMPGSVPYSLEKLVEADPDFLFIEVHGTQEYGQRKLQEDLESSPAWASLRAVKEGTMYFLPSDFVNNPGLNIDRPIEYLAKLVYPDVYGK